MNRQLLIKIALASLVSCSAYLQAYEPLTILYLQSCYSGIELYIPQKQLIVNDKLVDLKELFEKNNICLEAPSMWNWSRASDTLIKRSKKDKTDWMISLDDLPKALNDGKALLKSFLLKDDNELPEIEKNYIKKYGINRLFTYAKLHQVIEQKQLTHVRLPRKILTVKDSTTNRYLSNKEASQFIDEILRWCAHSTGADVELSIQQKPSKYEFIIFAHKESISGKGLSGRAKQQLETICQEAPFDVGIDNIFWDSQGVAVIIDTECKASPEDVCKNKLGRYPIDGSLPGRIKQPKKNN